MNTTALPPTERAVFQSSHWVRLLFFFILSACTSPIELSTSQQFNLRPQEPISPPGPPTVTRLVVQFDGRMFSLVSAIPKHGAVTEPEIAENLPDILSEQMLLIEYTALTTGGSVIHVGKFVVPLIARVEFIDPEVPGLLRRATDVQVATPVVKVNLPFHSQLATVQLARLKPSHEPVEKWQRLAVGSINIQLIE